ncbi:MAC/perforin domain-containing protein [Silvanigrella aquatica]|uniref:MACPF domain-containing protein n=1 Tax=Silvanigrella aquatica TaxID=1915309 RepID=A0A1L4D2N3_9BACT|nr:MAC/perforin domain-containing protein [Silvanigrella aquatica]APJ04452.1 hypothetical protein AXG55_11245 [Silvanigrella aquatica]
MKFLMQEYKTTENPKTIENNHVTLSPDKKILKSGNSLSSSEQILPGAEILGCGYDVRENYADPRCVKERLFDFGEYNSTINKNGKIFNIPNLIKNDLVVSDINNSKLEIIYGDKTEEYLKSISNKLDIKGKYNFFTASLSNNFSTKTFGLDFFEYVTVKSSHTLYKLILPESDKLSSFISKDFKSKLENYSESALDIMKKYGAYYLKEIIVGGRIDYNSQTNKMTFKSNSSIENVAKMSYNNLIGKISVEDTSKYNEDIKSFNNSSRISFNSYGGKPGVWNSDTTKPSEYNEWFNSVSEYAVLSDFTTDSLIPIWNLLDKSNPNYLKRKEEFENALQDYMKEIQIPKGTDTLLKVKMTNNFRLFGTDKGSGAKKDLFVYKPVVDKNEYWVGQFGINNNSFISSNTMLPIIIDSIPGFVKPGVIPEKWTVKFHNFFHTLMVQDNQGQSAHEFDYKTPQYIL